MPPVAAAVGAIGSAIGGIGAAAGSVLGGLAAAGGSALGGLATAGAGAIGGIGSLLSPAKYGVPGGLIGPATEPLTSKIGAVASKVAPIISAGSKLYGMFQGPGDQPTGGSPAPAALPTQTAAIPVNIMGTLPNLVRPPTPQIMTTPAPTPPADNLSKYLPIAAVIGLGFLILKGK